MIAPNLGAYFYEGGIWIFYSQIKVRERGWKEVYHAEELVDIADKLLAMPKCSILRTRFEDDKHFKEPE